MRRYYTVGWSASAVNDLAKLWLENPAIRQEISAAANRIDPALAIQPNEIGISRGQSRFLVYPPLAVLYRVVEDDRQVRVIHVKHWYD